MTTSPGCGSLASHSYVKMGDCHSPFRGTNPTDEGFQHDLYDSLYYSAAVFGINTSAQIEAAILGRPVLTMRSREFAHAQQGTLHFQYLVRAGDGFVDDAATLDEHLDHLHAALRAPEPAVERDRRFVASFVRPLGLHVPAAAAFVETVGALVARPPANPRPDPAWLRAARRPAVALAWAARALAEDRPLLIYALRPAMAGAVWTCAIPYVGREWWRDAARPRMKRASRWMGRTWHEWRKTAARRARRTLKPAGALVRGAARRLGGRNA